MHTTIRNTARLTVESIAPVIAGHRRTAPQPLGTWMSRWSFLYTDAAEAPGGASRLPGYVPAA